MQIGSQFLALAAAVSPAGAFSPFGLSARKYATVRTPYTLLAADGATVEVPPLPVAASVDRDSDVDFVRPAGSTNAWEVHKFGGASLATAELYRTVGDLLIREAGGRGNGTIPTMAVVSARGGMTDLLVKVVDSALVDSELASVALAEAVESQIALLGELAPPEIAERIGEAFRRDAADILSVVNSLRMLKTVPAVTMEVVTGFGEIWSAQTLHAYLRTRGVPCDWIDARNVLVVKGDSAGLGEKGAASTGGVTPLYDETAAKMSRWWNADARAAGLHDVDYRRESPILVVTGFVATTADGVPTTLKRSGSDYSATIFAKLTGAGRVTMWKNTNGVYTADPRRVASAFPIASLKYDEAMELAFFGAQVLHPSAMEPCIDDEILVYVRNIFNPAFEGTVIQGRSRTLQEASRNMKVKNWRANSGEVPIKGITSVDKTALVTLEGASIGGATVAARFMGAMADASINVLIITQASSGASITIAVPENEGELALSALEDAFELELSRSTINSLSVVPGMAIVAIVGEGMAATSGVSSTFMSSLSQANVNIRLIAQGSSELQVAVVVDSSDTSRALRAAHMAFTLSETTASVAILGSSGDIGSALVRQLQDQKRMLADDLGFEMQVNVAASSRNMILAEDSEGLGMDTLVARLRSDDAPGLDLDVITERMSTDVNPLRVIVDCTNNNDVAEYYEGWLSSGINIITPNRKVSAGPLGRYGRICRASKDHSARFMFESSVGSALPLCMTLTDLLETGDRVRSISGCLSGTMAYVLSTFSETVPFSEAVRDAVAKKITEADSREDLSGQVSAEKVVILARQMGLDIEVADVEVDCIVPEEIMRKEYAGSREEADAVMLDDFKCMDAPMLERMRQAKARDNELRWKFVIEGDTGKCRCSLQEVGQNDPLFRLKLNENLVAFETGRYALSPLIIKGAAAGPDLSASAIFQELLQLTRAYSSAQG